MLDMEATSCYLGDMLCSGGGCDSAIAARPCVTRGKFRKLLPVLTTRHLSLKVRSKVYVVCVCSVMIYGNETWGPNASDPQWLWCNASSMMHWISGTKNLDETPLASLLQKIGIRDITAVLHSLQPRWSGHVQRATMSCIKLVTGLVIPCTRRRGRLWKTWSECVKIDVSNCGLSGIGLQDRDALVAGVWCILVLSTPSNGTRKSP